MITLSLHWFNNICTEMKSMILCDSDPIFKRIKIKKVTEYELDGWGVFLLATMF
jgi:hypothetical protein